MKETYLIQIRFSRFSGDRNNYRSLPVKQAPYLVEVSNDSLCKAAWKRKKRLFTARLLAVAGETYWGRKN